jgi:chloramphenicol 3-O phosphotransferase
MGARVILINGVGSVGKSSTARELQRIAASPFLYVSMDHFIDMVPARLLGSKEGLLFTPGDDGGRPSIAISTGKSFETVMSGMRQAVAALADHGNDLIVDEAFWSGEEHEYRRLLQNHRLHLVGLFAPLDVIEEREHARGDRPIGLARWQFGRVHGGVEYDLKVDMSAASAAQAAITIRDAFDL